MDRKIYGIFVAGGRGVRMGSSLPKQFIEIGGVPVLMRTISRFAEALPEMKVVTVLPESWIASWKELCINREFTVPQILVPGGMTRFHSVRNALEKVPDGAVVLVHDGVRPLISVELIRTMTERMETERAVVPATPVTDTLKSTEPGTPDPDRSKMIAVQTPQIFLSEDLKRAYLQAYDPHFTDDASVAARAGIPVTYVEGEKYNIKITTPEDLPVAKAILGF